MDSDNDYLPDPFDEQEDFGMENIELPDPFEDYKGFYSPSTDDAALSEPPAKCSKVSGKKTSKVC